MAQPGTARPRGWGVTGAVAVRRLDRGSRDGLSLRAGERARAARREARAVCPAGRRGTEGCHSGHQFLHHHGQRVPGCLHPPSRARGARAPVQPTPFDTAGGSGRRGCHHAGQRGAGSRFLPGLRQAPDRVAKGGARPCGQPAASCVVAGGVQPRAERRGQRSRCGCRYRPRPRAALGTAGAVLEPASLGRPGRHRGAVRQATMAGYRGHVARSWHRLGRCGAGGGGGARCGVRAGTARPRIPVA